MLPRTTTCQKLHRSGQATTQTSLRRMEVREVHLVSRLRFSAMQISTNTQSHHPSDARRLLQKLSETALVDIRSACIADANNFAYLTSAHQLSPYFRMPRWAYPNHCHQNHWTPSNIPNCQRYVQSSEMSKCSNHPISSAPARPPACQPTYLNLHAIHASRARRLRRRRRPHSANHLTYHCTPS